MRNLQTQYVFSASQASHTKMLRPHLVAQYYGAKGSIRTDVVLRDDTNNVIAIYDVKTGDATIGAARAAELRAKTGAGPNVPIIELQAIHGVTRKRISYLPVACQLLSSCGLSS